MYRTVASRGDFNFRGARIRVPSGLRMRKWRHYLADYHDPNLVEYLEYGWPVNFREGAVLQSTLENHPSATNYNEHVDHYVRVELEHGALAGPFRAPFGALVHLSPLMTRPKRDSEHRRVIMDLSWPPGAAVNDGIDTESYLDGPATITLPTVDYMEQRVLALGTGAFLYKTDLARGYRQLRIDPRDWPLLGFKHRGAVYLDMCPPFGLSTSAMCMQRTAEAICYIHGKRGFYSRPYLDDFGGAESTEERARRALEVLQGVMDELGIMQAVHKICLPARQMVWLGILFDSVQMTMSIPPAKLAEVGEIVRSWQGRSRATRHDMQCLLGLLQFVASVSPPTRIFTNRMLQDLREAPARGSESLSLGFRRDLAFFSELLPQFNGVKIMDKATVGCQDVLELDACLSGCGAFAGREYYSEEFPEEVQGEGHAIARLELLNVVVALKVWARDWAGQRVKVKCDNDNACRAIQTGRSRDAFMQACVRELFLWRARFDVELMAVHCPGVDMGRADALSRAHMGKKYIERLDNDVMLQSARRVRVDSRVFRLVNEM